MKIDSNGLVPPDAKAACALAIMAKAPQPGAVKTRLAPPLTPRQAASLSTCFLKDIAKNIADVAAARGADGVVLYTPVTAGAEIQDLVPAGFKLFAQRGAALGERLLNGTRDLLIHGYRHVCLINSDSPTLPPSLIASAIDALENPGDRVVLGQSDDGGYYLIGLKKAHENLFDRIAWSTAYVLAHTVERAREIDLEVILLPRWYDVDDAETLSRLCSELLQSEKPSMGENGHRGFAATFTRDFLDHLLQGDGRDRIWPAGMMKELR
jgi:hypothetical protein